MGLQEKMLRRSNKDINSEKTEDPVISFSFPDSSSNTKSVKRKFSKKNSDSPENPSITFNIPENDEKVKFSFLPDKFKEFLNNFHKSREKLDSKDDKEGKSYADSEYDYELEQENTQKMRKDIQRKHKKRIYSKLGKILLIIGGIYLIFLIYGCITTDFVYNDVGNLVPVTMTFQDIKEKKEFEDLLKCYFNTRIIYEDILKFDYELARDSSKSVSLGTKYNGILDNIDKINTKVKALSTEVQYENLQNMLQNVIAEMSAYSNAMSKALLQNNSDSASEALQRRNNVYQKFMTISNNFAIIADTIPGIDKSDIEDIMSWSPDNYIQELIE